MAAPDPCKQDLRQRLLALRRGLDPGEIDRCSAALTEHLLADPLWVEARGLAAFVGVRNEPDTSAILERSVAAGKTVWLPRLTGPSSMRFWPCADFTTLEFGRMGLREPPIVNEGVVAPGPEHGVDLILVPGLGFGRDGARLGFGAGHYDRALAQRLKVSEVMPVLCGVCLSCFIEADGCDDIPMLAHDLPMHYVATEHGILRCGI